jgi:hypothetical protein
VPLTTAPLADVLSGDTHPPVALGRGDHVLEEATVCLLDLAAPRELCLRVAQPHREPVANPLQLGDAQHARPADRTDGPVETLARKGGCEDLAEPLLEHRDLATKVVANAPFGERLDTSVTLEQSVQSLDRARGGIALDLDQLVGHEALPSPGIANGLNSKPRGRCGKRGTPHMPADELGKPIILGFPTYTGVNPDIFVP